MVGQELARGGFSSHMEKISQGFVSKRGWPMALGAEAELKVKAVPPATATPTHALGKALLIPESFQAVKSVQGPWGCLS